jgi:hypothetical protein
MTMKMITFYAPWDIGVYSELIIVGSDPEMADYDNPRGHIIREQWFVGAQASDGRRKALRGVQFDDPIEAGFFANLYTGWDPEYASDDVWTEIRPMYGSVAYISSGTQADDLAWEREVENY